MRKAVLVMWLMVCAVSVFFGSISTVHAEQAKFVNLSDAVPGKYFDAASTRVDPTNPNKLVIRFNSGIDTKTFSYRDFRASSAAFYRTTAMDTISFVVVAPDGYYVAAVEYNQAGTGSVTRVATAMGGAQWVVDDVARDLGQFGKSPTMSDFVSLMDGQYRTVVPVSITVSLGVFAAPTAGSATVGLTSASVVVTLDKVPYVEPVVEEAVVEQPVVEQPVVIVEPVAETAVATE
jgi:hypothetical protein